MNDINQALEALVNATDFEKPPTTTKSGEEILAILLKHKAELEAYAERLDDLIASGKMRSVQQHIKDRWFYSIDAKQGMLQAILDEVQS